MDRLFRNLGFKIHFGVYVAVNLLLIAVNLLTTPHILWFYWPLLGWGIGIIAHDAAVSYSSSRRLPARVTQRHA
jgi:uncharacterized membrane protein